MKYLMTLCPLEPYTFVEEEDAYRILSSEMPSQSTLLGMLRYLILKRRGVLKTTYQYSKSERERIEGLIGPEGFSFGMEEHFRGFGVIEGISPVFLLDKDQNILIRNPFCNISEEAYLPVKLGKRIQTSWGEMALPESGQNFGSAFHGEGYLRLSDMKVVEASDIFVHAWDYAASFEERDKKRKESYFKREKCMLKEGYSFAFFVEFKEEDAFGNLMEQGICFLGKKSAAFAMKATLFQEIQEEVLHMEPSLESYIEHVFRAYLDEKVVEKGITRKRMGQLKQTWYYALSDIYVGGADTFSMYLITEGKREKVLSCGTVFSQKPEIPYSDYLLAAGYNAVIQIGG